MQIVHANRTDGANNVCIALIYDRSAASITNAATMRIFQAGWTNNSDVFAELFAGYADGHFWAAKALSVAGDLGAGIASTTTFTNATVAAGGVGAPTFINPPNAVAQQGWLKVYVGTTAYVLPYWNAA